LSRNNSAKKQINDPSRNKPTTKAPAKKLTAAQKERLRTLMAKSPPIEKLDPAIFTKLKTTISEAVAKTVPEYIQWLNSAFGEKIVAEDCPTPVCEPCGNDCPTPVCSPCGNDCPTPVCSPCGNDCPTPVCGSCGSENQGVISQVVDNVANTAINAAINAAISYTLEQTALTEGGIKISNAAMTNIVKQQLNKIANEISKGK